MGWDSGSVLTSAPTFAPEFAAVACFVQIRANGKADGDAHSLIWPPPPMAAPCTPGRTTTRQCSHAQSNFE